MENKSAYNPKTLLLLFLLFAVLLWLLFSLGRFIHKTSKIHNEIELIKDQNVSMRQEILDHQRYLEYLRTAERIEKEAKVQLGKMRPRESVVILYDEPQSLIPKEETGEDDLVFIPQSSRSNLEKWREFLFGESL